MKLTRTLGLLTIALVACKKDVPTESDLPATPVPTPVELCGDGALDPEEDCDLGDLNGPDGNCLADCTAAPSQVVVLSGTEVFGPALLDAIGVSDPAAPAGTGAWTPSETDLGGDGLEKFILNIPLYDFIGELSPEQFAALENAPYQPPQSWLGTVILSEIEEISFWTNTPSGESNTPYFLVLYTQLDGVDDTDWYGYRLTAVPSSARNADAPGDTWVQWSISAADNQLTFADQPTIGTFTGPALPTFDELVGASFDWSSVDPTYPVTTTEYGAEAVRFVSLQTGSGTDTTGTDAMLDLIEIHLTDGRSLVLDLEP